jgi:tRNA nucleotidyltransferase (CCA-adding enzyme)
MQVYCVGGAIRDELLGLPVRDRDWVVGGATPEMLVAQGFVPVGRDFPVFLHPETREEYALARTERKSGRGYRGFVVHFSPEVTLEDDLKRRDLTINAMARAADGSLIDPWHGQRDLREGVLRHVGEAFTEDPVRILRLARFAARFHDFTIAPETRALMKAMVAEGEVDHLVPERVWQELSRGLMEDHPSRMMEVLAGCGALARIAAGLAEAWNLPGKPALLDAGTRAGAELPVRFAVLLHGLPAEQAAALADQLRAPVDCRDIARLFAMARPVLQQADALAAHDLAQLVERLDGIRRPERMAQVLEASRIVHGEAGLARIRLAAEAVRAVDAGAVARAGPPATIRERLAEARAQAVAQALFRSGAPGPLPAATAGSSTSAESTSGDRTG